jgi:predicted extracellular nuclease
MTKAILTLLFTLNTVQAELLSTYTFTNAIGNEATFEPDNQPNKGTLSPINRGTGLTPKKAKDTFNAQNWSTGALDMTDYYSLTIQPNCGLEMTLTSLTLDERRSNKGIRNWSIRSSLDDFATDLKTFNVPDNTKLRNDQTITLNASFTNLTTPVEFRIYGFNAEAGTGTWRIDNVYINGNITDRTTKIHTIQSHAEKGNTHTISGIVVGDFQADTQLKGFFVQEEDTDIDDDPTTSEGLFIYNPDGPDVNVGDLVRVTGEVEEYYALTELKNISKVTICSRGATVTPTTINLPFDNHSYLERYEGMLIKLPQTLTVTNNYKLGHYGQITLSNGRLFAPTQITSPGANANAQQAQNDLNRIIIDDGSTTRNPKPIPYPTPKLSATHTLRCGDTVTGVTGVLNYSFGNYHLLPTSTPNFISANPRPATPPSVGGTLKVASFNVLNYFNGFPTSRGAKTASEFKRQRDKIINAIIAMQADIIGLIEIENDGYGANSAIADLTKGLNAAAPINTTYAFINPSFALGTDKIKVALIYRVETVTPIGVAATTTEPPFRRPPLAQTFREKASAEQITIVVNHFKSKGDCPNDNSLNEDQKDGQACWNAERVQAAKTLTAWLATTGEENILIIGDLNAYAKEEPITVIKNAGYTDLLQKFVGTNAYSYIYQAQAGSLDHALASAKLSPKVTGATEWHINADEPQIIDYKDKHYGAPKSADLYNAKPYRSSDHDPLIIGLNLANSSS